MLQATAPETELTLDQIEQAGRMPQLARTKENNGRPFVKFSCLRFSGRERKPYRDEWIFDLDSVAGTVGVIQKYENKPGWRIVGFGNLRLDPEERGVFRETVEEHTKIYYHCIRALQYKEQLDTMKAAAALAIEQAKQQAISEARAEIDAEKAEKDKEIERLKAEILSLTQNAKPKEGKKHE